jgi:hypothetical protein
VFCAEGVRAGCRVGENGKNRMGLVVWWELTRQIPRSGSAATAPIALGRVGKSASIHVQRRRYMRLKHMHEHTVVDTALTWSRAPHSTSAHACTHASRLWRREAHPSKRDAQVHSRLDAVYHGYTSPRSFSQ